MARDFKGFYFTFYFIFIFSFHHQTLTVFTKTPKSKFNSPFFTSLKSFVRRKPIPVFDPRPLYCSSLTTAVGGTLDIILLIPDHPTVARITTHLFFLHVFKVFQRLLLSISYHLLALGTLGSKMSKNKPKVI